MEIKVLGGLLMKNSFFPLLRESDLLPFADSGLAFALSLDKDLNRSLDSALPIFLINNYTNT